jgi:hypothetical protein
MTGLEFQNPDNGTVLQYESRSLREFLIDHARMCVEWVSRTRNADRLAFIPIP